MAQTKFTGPVVSDNGFEGNLTGLVSLTAYTLATLPTNADYANGTLIFVSDANTGAGTVAFNNGTNWIDIKTGAAVA